VLNSIAMHLHS